MKTFPESKLAHKYLDGLIGLEIGGSIHNPFGLNTKNIDYTDSSKTVFKEEENEMCGESLPVDIVAQGDSIPVPDESYDFIVSSHVLEHFPDPIRALKEWQRIVKEGGYIFIIIPHKERTFDRNKSRTKPEELIKRHETGKYPEPSSRSKHYSYWITEDFIDFVENINLKWQVVDFLDTDDKVGNGFTVVIKKGESDAEIEKEIKSRVEELKKNTAASEKKSKLLKRILELKNNTKKEYNRNGISGIARRILRIKKWES
jgi:ubiquinone/menaquinone biosynthesis C-methylase UbiE